MEGRWRGKGEGRRGAGGAGEGEVTLGSKVYSVVQNDVMFVCLFVFFLFFFCFQEINDD